MDGEALVVVKSFRNRFDADMARSALEAAGIESLIRSDDCGGQYVHFWMSGVALVVRADDAATALEILENEAN
jgi:hypothetical protein